MRRGYPDCRFYPFLPRKRAVGTHWECLSVMVQMHTSTNISMERLEKYIPSDKSAL